MPHKLNSLPSQMSLLCHDLESGEDVNDSSEDEDPGTEDEDGDDDTERKDGEQDGLADEFDGHSDAPAVMANNAPTNVSRNAVGHTKTGTQKAISIMHAARMLAKFYSYSVMFLISSLSEMMQQERTFMIMKMSTMIMTTASTTAITKTMADTVRNMVISDSDRFKLQSRVQRPNATVRTDLLATVANTSLTIPKNTYSTKVSTALHPSRVLTYELELEDRRHIRPASVSYPSAGVNQQLMVPAQQAGLSHRSPPLSQPSKAKSRTLNSRMDTNKDRTIFLTLELSLV
ncbi:uncharacterized protein EDB91DRAFT_1253300 [Suillus paluster]|uniref:uncharacterized protein n=1 Tax=Suillus paluster TaxID=48578 RepID=UPI001B85C995|nr:uncharacterized protein EDB91DRAFT_1253300 [Suillus paluster]KAG1728867.1 hypothetical protein EDB91DRAFT_1253300 [Suillus paluster]